MKHICSFPWLQEFVSGPYLGADEFSLHPILVVTNANNFFYKYNSIVTKHYNVGTDYISLNIFIPESLQINVVPISA